MKCIVMSDLHLSKKPWQVRGALKMGENADLVLLVGDLTNDGTPEQMALMHQCIAEVLPETPVLADQKTDLPSQGFRPDEPSNKPIYDYRIIKASPEQAIRLSRYFEERKLKK